MARDTPFHEYTPTSYDSHTKTLQKYKLFDLEVKGQGNNVNAYPNTFYSHFGSIKIILKDKRNSPPAYLPHIFQIYFIFDLIKRCAAQNITWCVLSAGLLAGGEFLLSFKIILIEPK
jgi:hypothetical protein